MTKEGVLKEICDTLKGEFGHTAPGHPTDIAYCRINRGATTISEEKKNKGLLVIRGATVMLPAGQISAGAERVQIERLWSGTIEDDGRIDFGP